MSCQHTKFDAEVVVDRSKGIDRISAELRIRCVNCPQHFQFFTPTVSTDGFALNAAIRPREANAEEKG